MATNERNVERMVEVIDNASRHARMVYYLYLGFIAYCAVTVFSTTDRQLALKGDTAELPILDISVPLDGFFILAPILAIGLFVYFMLYLHRLNSLIEGLGESYDKKQLYPWMINIAREPEDGTIGLLQKLFVGLTLWFTLPVTMFIFASKFLKKHEDFLSYLIVALAFASIFIVFWFWNNLRKKEYSELLIYTLLPVIVYLFINLTAIFIPKINDGDFKWANLDLRNELLVTVPDKEKDFGGVYCGDLEGVNLNGADLTNAVFKRANLSGAKLNNADLSNADLRKSKLSPVLDKDGKIIIEAATLENAILRDTNLQEADLSYANLQEAYLEGANLQETDLISANLQGANLSYANLQGAELYNANLQEAALQNANLQGANLESADLQEADLYNANLQEADLVGANNLTKDQLCEAGTLWNADINKDLLKQVENKVEGCPDKLEKESYDEWVKKWEEIQRQKWQEKAEDKNQEEELNTQEKLLKMQEEIITIQKTLIEQSKSSESQ